MEIEFQIELRGGAGHGHLHRSSEEIPELFYFHTEDESSAILGEAGSRTIRSRWLRHVYILDPANLDGSAVYYFSYTVTREFEAVHEWLEWMEA